MTVVTGAAQGIGRGVALRLAQEGGCVVLADRSELVHEARDEAGGEALAVVADMEQYADCRTLMAAAVGRFGRVDILVNNVGGTIWAKPLAEYQEAEIEAKARRSLLPKLWCCHAVPPVMLAGAGGSIVNVSSVATRGLNRAPYAAAKGGVNALTVGLAWEYAGRGIRVNAVAPSGTEAPPRRIPRNAVPPTPQEQAWYQQVVDQTIASSFQKRYGTIAEQTAAILFLASDKASLHHGHDPARGRGRPGLDCKQPEKRHE